MAEHQEVVYALQQKLGCLWRFWADPRNNPPTLNLESAQRLQSLFCQQLLWYMHDAHKSVFIRAFV